MGKSGDSDDELEEGELEEGEISDDDEDDDEEDDNDNTNESHHIKNKEEIASSVLVESEKQNDVNNINQHVPHVGLPYSHPSNASFASYQHQHQHQGYYMQQQSAYSSQHPYSYFNQNQYSSNNSLNYMYNAPLHPPQKTNNIGQERGDGDGGYTYSTQLQQQQQYLIPPPPPPPPSGPHSSSLASQNVMKSQHTSSSNNLSKYDIQFSITSNSSSNFQQNNSVNNNPSQGIGRGGSVREMIKAKATQIWESLPGKVDTKLSEETLNEELNRPGVGGYDNSHDLQYLNALKSESINASQSRSNIMMRPRTIRSIHVYELEDIAIGEGAFGKVFKGYEKSQSHLKPEDRDYVVLKLVKTDRQASPLRSFPIESIREIRLLSGLRHDNIINLREVVASQEEGTNKPYYEMYLVFDCMDGDLKKLLFLSVKHKETITNMIIFRILKQLISALKEIHSKKILHRDLKPDNLFLNSKCVLKIGDFGAAKNFETDDANMKALTPEVITGWYRPPEVCSTMRLYHQNKGKVDSLTLLSHKNKASNSTTNVSSNKLNSATDVYGYDLKVDMWSVGCIIGEMISNNCSPIFSMVTERDNYLFNEKLENRIRDTDFSYPALLKEKGANKRWRNTIDDALLQLMAECLKKDPFERISATDANDANFFFLERYTNEVAAMNMNSITLNFNR